MVHVNVQPMGKNGKKCKKCDKLNHFAIDCKVKKIKELTEQINVESASKESSFCIDQVEIANINSRWFEMIQINESNVKVKLDTGADVNVLPLNIYNKIKKSNVKLESTNMILESFGGNKIKPLGITELLCTIKNVTKKQEFVIVKADTTPLLGLYTCREFNLIKRIHILQNLNIKDKFISENVDIFEGNGTFKKKVYN